MKILYAVQGTGNGHASRASEFIPMFRQHGSLDVLVSGNCVEVDMNQPINYHLRGISYTFGRRGGIDLPRTLQNLSMIRFLKDVRDFPIHQYDLVINDFEPVTAWAAKRAGIPCVALSHQAAFLSANTPRPAFRNPAAEALFRYFSPAGNAVGFHFNRYDTFIHTPLIRSAVRNLNPVDRGHITVYLPAYDDQWLSGFFRKLPDVKWQIFSKTCRAACTSGNVDVMPVSGDDFLKSLESCSGFICGAGFEAPAEALYLGKKLMVIPMKSQYEQKCNAAALKQMGVAVESSVGYDFPARLGKWLGETGTIKINFQDNKTEIVDQVLKLAELARTEFSPADLSSVHPACDQFSPADLSTVHPACDQFSPAEPLSTSFQPDHLSPDHLLSDHLLPDHLLSSTTSDQLPSIKVSPTQLSDASLSSVLLPANQSSPVQS